MSGRAPLLLHVFPTFAIGGSQTRFCALVAAFGERYRHIVTAMDGNFACADRLPAGLDLRCQPIEAAKGATLGNVRRFRRLLREIAPDVLVTYNWGSIEWAMANIPRSVRHVHVEDGFGPEEQTRQIPRRVLTRRLVLRRSIVAVPSHTLARIATEVWRLNRRQVRYVPNGIDLARFSGARETGPLVTIGTVATLRPEKNLARMLRAFRHVVDVLPEVQLIIVGDGAERPGLERLARELGLAEQVNFAGYIAEPAPLYRRFDVFALSSDTEQMPLSVMEAMAAGLPVATTDVGDVVSMLAAENRAFITARDDASLAEAIVELARNARLRSSLGAANRAKAEAEFGATAMVAAWQALFDGTG